LGHCKLFCLACSSQHRFLRSEMESLPHDRTQGVSSQHKTHLFFNISTAHCVEVVLLFFVTALLRTSVVCSQNDVF
jgi:hypothetical protein